MKYAIIFMMIFMGPCMWPMEHIPHVFKNMPQGVQRYIQSLPTIASSAENGANKSDIIVNYLLRLGGYKDAQIDGCDALRAKIAAYIAVNKPIVRCMPAFPVSSANFNKLPFDDQHAFSMGDFIGLLTRNHISGEISKVYPPGSCVSIYWEPFVHDMNNACYDQIGYAHYPQERIAAYQATLKKVVQYLQPYVQMGNPDNKIIDALYAQKYASIPIALDHEKVHHYEIFMKQDLDTDIWMDRSERKLFDQNREPLEKKYPAIKSKSFETIKQEPVYKKIKSALGARKYLHVVAATLAETAYKGSQRMALLMENEIPDYKNQVRESVRADYSSVRKKIGTPIIYNVEGTPWHKALVVGPQGIDLAHYASLGHTDETPLISYYAVDDMKFGFIDQQQ